MEKTNLEYKHKINESSHTYDRGDNFGEEGINPFHVSINEGVRCEFCNHPIAWVWKLKDENDKIWMVGSECVFNLLHLEEEKKKAYKSLMAKIGRLERCKKKYNPILVFLKENVKFTTPKELIEKGEAVKGDKYKNKSGMEYYSFQAYSRGGLCRSLTEEQINNQLECFNHFHDYAEAMTCPVCCAIEIIRKVEEVGTLNEFWLKRFEELSGLKLPEVKNG